MAIPDILFYVFAFLTLACGVLVVANPFNRNPVTSAMFLVLLHAFNRMRRFYSELRSRIWRPTPQRQPSWLP